MYTDVNLKATDVAMTNKFPVAFSMGLPGGGTMKIDGTVGPVDQKDAALTPQDVKLAINNMNLASTGFLDPKLGLGRDGQYRRDACQPERPDDHERSSSHSPKRFWLQVGSPLAYPSRLILIPSTTWLKGSGVLNPSDVKIGNAKSNLSGTYKSAGDDFVVDLKLNGQGLPATDLEAFLPALGINLPSGSKLTAGTLSTNLHISGPTDQLVTDGNIGLFNGKLSGFDLGSKMSAVGSLGRNQNWPGSRDREIHF